MNRPLEQQHQLPARAMRGSGTRSSQVGFDTDTANLPPIKIELLRYQLFEKGMLTNGMLTLDTESYQKVKIAGMPKLDTESKESVQPLQRTFTLEEHTAKGGPTVRKIFDDLRERILGLDQEMQLEPKKLYVAFKMTRNVVDIVVQKPKLWMFINVKTGTLDDPRGIAEDLATPVKVGHWGNGDYRVEITSQADLDYVMTLVKQSYEMNR